MEQINPTEVTREQLSPCGLTPEQRRKWEQCMSLMSWTCPGTQHLFYKLLVHNKGEYGALMTDGVPIAATDGKNLILNPETFFKYDIREQVFIAGHEIWHNVFCDVDFIHRCRKAEQVPMTDGTYLPFDEKAMQHSMDYRINALLKAANIGKPPKGVLLDEKIAKAEDGVADVYKKVYEDYKKNGKLGGDGFDVVLVPGTSTGQSAASAAQNQQQWKIEIKTAQTIEAMRTQGDMPGALKRMFEQLLNPQIPWTEKIKSIYVRTVGSGTYNWRRPDRRFIVRDLYLPSRAGFSAGHVVEWGDTSGSMSDKELCHTIAESRCILEECRPSRLTLVWCDSKIHRVDELNDPADLDKVQYDAAKDGIGGGGGTAVNPVFDWIEKLDRPPDMFIGFTDGFVNFPKIQPSYPVIWASTVKEPKDYPWGEVVKIDTVKS